MKAGGVNCSDGTFIGAGSGLPFRTIDLEVLGGQLEGGTVTLRDGECLLEGPREGGAVRAEPVSGCDVTLVSAFFQLAPDDSMATLSFSHDPDLVPAADRQNGVGCVLQSFGDLERD